jgi:hypothetical protein
MLRAMEHSVSNCALLLALPAGRVAGGVWLAVQGNNFEILLRICGFI